MTSHFQDGDHDVIAAAGGGLMRASAGQASGLCCAQLLIHSTFVLVFFLQNMLIITMKGIYAVVYNNYCYIRYRHDDDERRSINQLRNGFILLITVKNMIIRNRPIRYVATDFIITTSP